MCRQGVYRAPLSVLAMLALHCLNAGSLSETVRLQSDVAPVGFGRCVQEVLRSCPVQTIHTP
jgi:hypothetical protein